jgi:hypothetical protein
MVCRVCGSDDVCMCVCVEAGGTAAAKALTQAAAAQWWGWQQCQGQQAKGPGVDKRLWQQATV